MTQDEILADKNSNRTRERGGGDDETILECVASDADGNEIYLANGSKYRPATTKPPSEHAETASREELAIRFANGLDPDSSSTGPDGLWAEVTRINLDRTADMLGIRHNSRMSDLEIQEKVADRLRELKQVRAAIGFVKQPTANAFDPNKHPKDEHGRWSGVSRKSMEAAALHLGAKPKNVKAMDDSALQDHVSKRMSMLRMVGEGSKADEAAAKMGVGNPPTQRQTQTTHSTDLKSLLDEHGHHPRFSDEYQSKIADPVMKRIEAAPVVHEAIPAILKAVQDHQRGRIGGFITLKELHDKVRQQHPNISADSLLHTVAQGAEKGALVLHPYTGSQAAMKDHNHTIPVNREFMQYVEVVKP